MLIASIFTTVWAAETPGDGGGGGGEVPGGGQGVPLDPITGLGTGYQTEAAIGAPLTTAETLLSNATGFLTVAGGVTFMIYIILAGLTWITAREESERISKAKQMFTNALVGLAILVVAWAFTGVMETIFGFKILNPAQVLKNVMPK